MRAIPATQAHLDWLVRRVGCARVADLRGVTVEDASGRTLGVAGLCSWTPNGAELHFALSSPTAIRSLAPAVAEYLFLQSERVLALARVVSSNVRSRRLVEWLGFREAHRIRGGWADGVDIILYEMRRDDCRFLRFHRKAA